MLDFIVTNTRIADLFRLRLFDGWVGIRNGRFVYVEAGSVPEDMQAEHVLDASNMILVPGLIDAHMHIESSLITPRRFAEAVLPWGTTTILSDPHEVGNVAGEAGVKWMIDASRNLPLRILHSIPSCVPATSPEIEWTGDVFDANTIASLAQEDSVIALGEVMDYMGLLGMNPRLQQIVLQAKKSGLLIEGHIPTLSGTDLSQYLAHGVSSDHTLTFADKIHEQISKGVVVMLQTKSITPENIAVVLDLADPSRVLLITDDIEPTLLQEGHLSRMVELAISVGMPTLSAFAAASLYPARYLGQRDTGAIAPGYHADFMLLKDLNTFPPEAVYVSGKLIAEQGKLQTTIRAEYPPLPDYPAVPAQIQIGQFRITEADDNRQITANIVALQNKKITLTKLETSLIQLRDGYPQFDDDDELAIAAILARNGKSYFAGLIKNTGLKAGAFASTVAHDSHNLLVIGRNPESMLTAAQGVSDIGGGVVIARDNEIITQLELPYFGLLSDEPVPIVAHQLDTLQSALRELGVDHARPFLTLSIMGLSVSPYVKFTDKGIIDTEKRQLLPLIS
ncbi:MAG: adenine deaminase C-terminal domain-containing protein [Anaerolineae bacterium]|nr:adenine deaminase C-terminal domain-containing protein [Anaerolineae bacterium]